MSSSLRRSRFRARVPDEDLIAADVELGSRTSTESSTDPGEYEADLESMTGKGIKRLCSELLELKKTSDDDFQRNVYSNYSAFVRIFEEIGGVESEIMELKKHASTHTKLIQALMSNFYADMVSDSFKETKVENLGLSSPSWFGIHMQDVQVTLDILLSEWRLNETLAVLEKETLTLQKLQIEEDRSSPIIMSYTYALSERRTRLAGQLASMAEHPRVSQPELQKALSGLCKLGENHRANSLLLNFYRSRLQKKVHELQCSKPCPYGTHIRELAKVVFSAISQAARCFGVLYGETSPYSSELILWAREETEAFSHNFHTYVRSISEMNGALSLAIEAANSAISLCSLLKSQRIFLLPDLMELIRPCMEEVLQMHVDHFRKVVHIFTTTDNWTLGKFLSLGILRDKSSVTGIGDKVEYCLLTSSGRKFVTLMQGITDDISPLVNLRMGSSILKGLADLFSEYMCALERAFPNGRNAIENFSSKVSSAQTLQQQLSLLVNASTLVHFLPSIAGSIFKGTKSSNDDLSSEQTENFSENELDDWILSVEEAAKELRCYFCQQFVLRAMSHAEFKPTTCLNNWFIPSSTQDPMPSFAFQALFLRLRQLKQLSKSIFVGEDRMMEKLPKEIVERVIVWLSNNQELWTKTVDQTSSRQCISFEQVHLDIHFLLEIAILGGYCSNDLIVAAMDLIEEMEVTVTETGSGPNRGVPDGDWAPNAVKLAIEKLLEIEVANFESEIEPATTSLRDSRTENLEDNCPSNGKDLIHISQSSTILMDGKTENLDDEDVTRLIEMKDIVSESFEEQTSDDYDDDDGSRNSTVPCSDREDEDADRANTGTNSPTENEDTRELELERRSIKAEVQSVGSLDDFDDLAAQPVAEELQVILGKENLELENKLLENRILRGQESMEGLEAEVLESIGSLDDSNAVDAILTTEEQDISREETVVMQADLLEDSKLKETEGMRELVEEEHTAYFEVESVGGLQQHDANAIASQPATDDLVDIAQKENLLEETELLHADSLREVGGRKELEIGVCTSYPQGESVDKLDGCDAIAAQAGIDELNYIPEQGNLLVETEPVAYDLNIFVSHNLSSRSADEVDNNLSDVMRLDPEKKIILLEDTDNSSTMSQELVQVDSSEIKDEPTILELQTVEIGDKLLTENLSQLVLATSPQKQGQDGVIHAQGSGKNASGASVRQRAIVKRRSKTPAPILGRNEKVSNESDSSDGNNPSDVLVNSTVHNQDKKLAVFEDSARPATMLKELVQVDESPVEGEPALLEPLRRSSSDSVVMRSLQEQGEDAVEASANMSSDSLLQISGREQSQAASAAEKNGEGLDGSGGNRFVEVKNPSDGLNEKIVLLEAEGSLVTESEELVQVNDFKFQADGSLVNDETAIFEALTTEEEEKLLSAKLSELALETSLQKQGSDGRNSDRSSGNTSEDPSRQRGGRKRSKSSAEENVAKSRKGAKALRPRWH